MGHDSRNVLDDFSRRRLKDLPGIHELRAQTGAVEWLALVGLMVTRYTRHELDIIRAGGHLSIRELQVLGQLDRSWAEYFALQGESDPTVCAHCGEDITRARKVIEVDLLGTTRRFHEARPACAKAARWLNITPPTRRQDTLGEDGPDDDGTIVAFRKDDDT